MTEEQLREVQNNYNEIFKVVGEVVGLRNFNFSSYLNLMMTSGDEAKTKLNNFQNQLRHFFTLDLNNVEVSNLNDEDAKLADKYSAFKEVVKKLKNNSKYKENVLDKYNTFGIFGFYKFGSSCFKDEFYKILDVKIQRLNSDLKCEYDSKEQVLKFNNIDASNLKLPEGFEYDEVNNKILCARIGQSFNVEGVKTKEENEEEQEIKIDTTTPSTGDASEDELKPAGKGKEKYIPKSNEQKKFRLSKFAKRAIIMAIICSGLSSIPLVTSFGFTLAAISVGFAGVSVAKNLIQRKIERVRKNLIPYQGPSLINKIKKIFKKKENVLNTLEKTSDLTTETPDLNADEDILGTSGNINEKSPEPIRESAPVVDERQQKILNLKVKYCHLPLRDLVIEKGKLDSDLEIANNYVDEYNKKVFEVKRQIKNFIEITPENLRTMLADNSDEFKKLLQLCDEEENSLKLAIEARDEVLLKLNAIGNLISETKAPIKEEILFERKAAEAREKYEYIERKKKELRGEPIENANPDLTPIETSLSDDEKREITAGAKTKAQKEALIRNKERLLRMQELNRQQRLYQPQQGDYVSETDYYYHELLKSKSVDEETLKNLKGNNRVLKNLYDIHILKQEPSNPFAQVKESDSKKR